MDRQTTTQSNNNNINNNNNNNSGNTDPTGQPSSQDPQAPHNQFVILQFENGSQQDVIIDYRNNIRNAIEQQRQRRRQQDEALANAQQERAARSSERMSSAATMAPPRSLAPTSQNFSGAQRLNEPALPPAPPVSETAAPVRGVDFPAFDVSSEGVYAQNRTLGGLFDLLASVPNAANTAPNTAPNANNVNSRDNMTTASSAESVDTPSSSTQSANNANRNIILTVNYEYSSGVEQDDARGRSASLVLNVPNIPQGEDDGRLQALIRFATIIAFRTIAMSLANKHKGVSEEQFKSLPVRSLTEIPERDCPICYEELLEPTKKRKRDESHDGDESADDNSKGKFQKSDLGEKNETTDSQKTGPKTPVQVQYVHVPVEMPCTHVFGQDCLHEWLKTNNSCPLCRQKVFENERGADGIPTTTMNLLNLATFLDDNVRDSLLNGEIHRLPMFVVSNDSDATTAAESLDNDLGNGINTLPIIVAASPLSMPSIFATPPPGAGAALNPMAVTDPAGSVMSTGTGTVLNRFTRDNIVRRIINSLTQSISGGNNIAMSSFIRPGSTGTVRTPDLAVNRERPVSHIAGPHGEFINRDPLFPVGVSSRRTANGVETVNMGQFGDQPHPNDISAQHSIINDLIVGALRRGLQQPGSSTPSASANSQDQHQTTSSSPGTGERDDQNNNDTTEHNESNDR